MIIFADPHIEEQNIQELDDVFAEISSYCDDKTIICLGDWYHKKRPSPKELEFGTRWAKNIAEDRYFILLKGNHPEISDEISSIDYLKYVEDIEIVDDLYHQGEKVYFAHKSTDKSEMRYASDVPYLKKFEISIKELEKYDLVLLGHQHNFQHVADNIYHLGSCINTTFNEIGQKKFIARISNVGVNESVQKLEFIELKSVIPMIEVFNIDDLPNIPQRTKVRLTINSFDEFKKWVNCLDEWRKYFYVFKTKLNFTTQGINTSEEIKEKKSFQEIINKWLESIEDEQVRKELENEFMDENR